MGKFLVVADEHTYLAIVDADVGFHHFVRNMIVIPYVVIYEIENHDRVVHGSLAVAVNSEAIVVKPRLHDFYKLIHGMVERQYASVIA